MNCKPFTAVTILCAIVILSVCSLSVNADSTNPFMAISTPMAFTPATQFPIPITNGSISFAQIGYYENATLANDTWVFNHLQLDSQQNSLLSDSPTTANLNITTQDSNVTITSFERLLTPDGGDINNTGSWLTAGWLNYTVSDVGRQVIAIQFNLANWTAIPQDEINGTETWPINVNVYVDGKQADYNSTWIYTSYDNGITWTYTNDNGIIPYGIGLIVNNANSNVSIKYAWAPVPAPENQSPTDSRLPATKASISPVWLPYLMLVAVASAVIVSVVLFTNRHRLKSMLNKRTKPKRHLET